MVCFVLLSDWPERGAAIGSQTHGESELGGLAGKEGTSRWWPASKTPDILKFSPAANQGSPVLTLTGKTIT